MIKHIDVILKTITLLNRESELKAAETASIEISHDLAKTILEIVTAETGNKFYSGGESETLENLKFLLKDMLNNTQDAGYDKSSIMQSLSLIAKDNVSLLKTFEKSIDVELSTPSLKRTTVSLRNQLNNYHKEWLIKSAITKTSYRLTTGNTDSKSITEIGMELAMTIEAMSQATKTKDEAIVDEIDLSDSGSMESVLTKAREQSTEDGRFKTGWKDLNEMLNGGFRAGEMVLSSGMQHDYKSGLMQSLFSQLPMYNKPKLIDPAKKPLMLYISLEDDADIITNFIYSYLYYAENDKKPNLAEVTNGEISSYIKERLTKNGFHIKIIRVNPSEWTYKKLFNKLLEYEAQGYEIKTLFVDYLSKLPTTGCTHTGVTGSDLRDLFNRVRNHCSSRGILVFTPHQLSSDAKQLLRNGIPHKDLVKEVANKGYYEGSRQLDQVVDVEIHHHVAYINKEHFLTFQRGKRRFPEIIDESKKYFMLKFPYKAPMKPDVETSDITIADTPKQDTSSDFDF